LVVQLIQDYEDYVEVNKQLEKMGYNIGTRLIEEFLAKSSLGRCGDFKDVGEVIAKVGEAARFRHRELIPPRPGRIQIIPEHHPEHHSRTTATTDIDGCEYGFDVFTDLRR